MKKGDIITLEDNEKYLLLLETEQEGHKFFYSNKLTDDENTSKEYEIIEEIHEDDDTYIEIVEDEEIKEFLTAVFTAEMVQLASDIESGKIDVTQE